MDGFVRGQAGQVLFKDIPTGRVAARSWFPEATAENVIRFYRGDADAAAKAESVNRLRHDCRTLPTAEDEAELGFHCEGPGGGDLIQNVDTSTVLTIGHSTRTWIAFLELLRAHRVERILDVRSIPRSRHNPQFNQETLRTKLRAARIGYAHLRKLGGLRHARRDSSNMGWRNRSFRGFADHMQTSEFDAGLQRLIKLAGQKRSALMCAGAVPWRCYRSLIADALTVLGIRVEDIMSKNRSQVHSLTSFGRVRRSRITYPFSKGSLLSSHVRSKRSGKRTER